MAWVMRHLGSEKHLSSSQSQAFPGTSFSEKEPATAPSDIVGHYAIAIGRRRYDASLRRAFALAYCLGIAAADLFTPDSERPSF